MSDYKIVNGKKVRVCKYGCDTELAWSDEISGFIEQNGGVTHTKERCKEVKEKKNGKERVQVATIDGLAALDLIPHLGKAFFLIENEIRGAKVVEVFIE
jgi:hypothetical protein